MSNFQKKAFTLAEAMVVIFLIGVLSVFMIKSAKNSKTDERERIAKAFKAIEAFDYASSQICELDANCPFGKFMVANKTKRSTSTGDDGKLKVTYTYTYAKSVTVDSSAALRNLYAKYIKFEKTYDDFCTYSGYCSSGAYPGGKISGDIHVGLELLSSISDCPNYYMPDPSGSEPSTPSEITVQDRLDTGAKPKCWGKLYIDVNGTDAPNTLGKDVFVFGLDEKGVHH